MRKWCVLVGVALPTALAALAARPQAARAQQQGGCAYSVGHQSVTFGQGTPSEATYLGGGVVFNCPDGRVIKADSVVVLTAGDQRLMYGHASYSDKEKTLTADEIDYYGGQHHMFAKFGASNPLVTLVDKVNGAVIRGQFMDYYPAQGSQESKTTIYSTPGAGRPHAVLHGKSQKGPAPRDSTAAADSSAARR